MLIYLAGPIDGAVELEVFGRGGRLTDLFVSLGHTTYKPHRAFGTKGKNEASKICAINRAAIALSDVVVADLSRDGKAFGTCREIEFARANAVPVFVIGTLVSLEAHDVRQVDLELWDNEETWRKLLAML